MSPRRRHQTRRPRREQRPFFEDPGYRARMARAHGAMPSLSEPEEWLRWVLDFAREDLDGLDADARAQQGDIIRELSPAFLRRESWTGSYDFTIPMSDAHLTAIQQELRDGLSALVHGEGTWNLPAPTGASIWRVNPQGKQPEFRMGWSGDDRASFLHGVAALLVAHGARLRACKQCGGPFLRRKRAEYCSKQCGQNFRDQKKAQRQRGGRR